jgi:pSer/pThr/pTyr-binding forkhead associated (FHA) protein
MTDHPTPSAGGLVVVHLLDSAQGHSLQTWRFGSQNVITIGRGEENDVALADPHVSRSHAKLVCNGGSWTLVSTGRHGTLVDDRLVSEIALQHNMAFRLGANGPMLRFDTHAPESRRSETMDNISEDLFSMLEIDELRKQQDVEQITGHALFQELRDQSRRRKTGDTNYRGETPPTGEETI